MDGRLRHEIASIDPSGSDLGHELVGYRLDRLLGDWSTVGLARLTEEHYTLFLPNVGDWLDPTLAPVLLGVILAAALGTAVLFSASLIVYSRRRTTRYLLVSIILGALVARSMVGLGTVFGITPMTIHHLVEHSFDFLIALTVMYAVYRSRTTVDITE